MIDNLTNLFNFLIKLFQNDPRFGAILITIIFFILIGKEIIPIIWKITETILRNYNLLKDPIYVLVEKLSNKMDTFIREQESSLITLLNMTKIIADKQHSYLTNDQVNIVTKLIFQYLEIDLMMKFIEEYENNNKNIKENIKNIFEITIKDTDRHYFQLPNTIGKVLSTENKIKSFYNDDNNENTYEKIIRILNENNTIINKKTSIFHELNNLIEKWYQTI